MQLAPLPEQMTAIEIREPGPPNVLTTATRPVPQPGPGEILIRVAAAGVNRPDCLQRRGLYPPPPGASDLPGLEVAGEIVGIGEGVAENRMGDTVCALLAGGGYAQYCVAPVAQSLPVPEGLSPVQAAALPETFFTVWTNIFDRGALQPGETILIHGGASGIGTTAIQMARIKGANVIATAGNNEKSALCRKLGAARAINYQDEKFVEAVKEHTNGQGVDVILDIVGGAYLDDNIKCLAPDGRLVIIGILGGAKAELNLGRLLSKRGTIITSTLRSRSSEFKGEIADALRSQIWPHLESGEITPVIQDTFPLNEAARAHELIENNQAMGKLVLIVE
jgi:putative PIG3 family NAD(P)H quinone oxidoreductase